MSTITASSLLGRNHHPLSILHDSIPFLKNQSFTDDLNMLGDDGSSIIDHHSIHEYNSRLKLPEFDDCESESSLLSIGQTEVKILGAKNQNMKMFDGMNDKHSQKVLDRMDDAKILGSKIMPLELTSQYSDFKYLNSYDQFFKSVTSDFTSLNSIASPLNSIISDFDGVRKEVKILGKKLENEILAAMETGADDGIVDLHDEAKPVSFISTT